MNREHDLKVVLASVGKQQPMRFMLVTLALGMFLGVAAVAQDVPSQKVDQIFSVYDKPGSPGCSLGVIRNGEFVYRKAYGLASLELGVPLSRRSPFFTWVQCRSN
jgi:CubicO group peptidase (beta-lactamase class C family)